MERIAVKSIMAAVAFTLLASPTAAQNAGQDDNKQLQTLIRELRDLLDRAEQERSADPWLIRDMRELLAEYDWPWTELVYAEDFTKAGSLPERWRVVAGEFRVDGTLGLRSVISREQPTQQAQDVPRQEKKSGDRMREMLGQMLEEAIKPKSSGGQTEQTQQASQPDLGRVLGAMDITNAFAMRIEFSARQIGGSGGAFAVGPYQGQDGEAGYRLVYHPDPAPGRPVFELVKRSPRDTESTIDFYEGDLTVADGATHTLLWTRGRQGRMEIDFDGQRLMEATDRGFGDPFRGIAIANTGGDYAVRSLVVKAVP